MKKVICVGISLSLILAFTAPAFSQAAADGTAYGAIYNEKDNAKKAELSEKFIKDFKDTSAQYSEPVAKIAIQSYAAGQNWTKIMEVADLVGQVMPKATPATSAYIYSAAMGAASQANNSEKIVTYGEKVLAVDPNNLQALLAVSTTIPENLPKDEAAKTAAMDKALMYGKKLTDMPKPAALPDAAWAEQVQAPVRAAMGLVQYTKTDYPAAVTEYQEAVKLDAKNGISWYYLGLSQKGIMNGLQRAVVVSYDEANAAITAKADPASIATLTAKRDSDEGAFKQQRDVVIDSLAKAVALGGAAAAPARQQLEPLYTAKNGSADGLDALIASKK